jgi:hexosaminidase
MYRLIFILLSILFLCNFSSGVEHLILPEPEFIEPAEGSMVINAKTRIVFVPSSGDRMKGTAKFLKKQIYETTGLKLKVGVLKNKVRKHENLLILASDITPVLETLLPENVKRDKLAELGREGYLLEISDNAVFYGKAGAGVFYAAQSFLQLLKYRDKTWSVPRLRILDRPRYPFRGQHFDPARQFRDVELLKKYIRILSRHKMNIMHIHFTDDQGWTLESKKYNLTLPGKFYTQKQLKKLVKYAREHFVTIVPEIDVPGHCGALRKAYPAVACQAGGTGWSQLVCAGKEETYSFFEDIFAELCPIFEGPYFHIGADEVPVGKWKHCQICSKRISDENLDGEEGLYFYFVDRIQRMLKKNNKRIIVWWEYLPRTIEKIDKDIILHKWRRRWHEIIPETIKSGFKVIDSSWHPLYLSHNTDTPADILNYNPLSIEGCPENTLGILSCSWGDRKEKTEDRVLLPRILAVAEKAWSGKSNSAEFNRRMTYHFTDIIEGIPEEHRGAVDSKYPRERLMRAITDPDDSLGFFKDNITSYIFTGPEGKK